MAVPSHRSTILIGSLFTLLLWGGGWIVIGKSNVLGNTEFFSSNSHVSKPQTNGAPPRPNRPPPKSITPSKPLTAPEYKQLYQEARAKEAASNPELKKILELQRLRLQDKAKLDAAMSAIGAWLRAPTDRAEQGTRRDLFQSVQTSSYSFAILNEWRDDDLRAALKPDDPQNMRLFAKDLVRREIDPTPFLTDATTARAAIDSIQTQIQQKFTDFLETANLPPDIFNQATFGLMRESSIADALEAKTYHLVSPATRQLADYEYRMRTRGNLREIEH